MVVWAVKASPVIARSGATKQSRRAWSEALDCFAALARTDNAVAKTARLVAALSASPNDLEVPARRLAPVIADVLRRLAAQPGCRLARMSGSGATCFALFDDCRASAVAAKALARQEPGWWVKPTLLR